MLTPSSRIQGILETEPPSNPGRSNLKALFDETRHAQLEEKLGKRQQELVMFFKLGKYFRVTASSPLHYFLDRRQNVTQSYLLGCFLKEAGGYTDVDRGDWITTSRFLVRTRDDITEYDIEYEDPQRLVRRMQETG